MTLLCFIIHCLNFFFLEKEMAKIQKSAETNKALGK